MTIPGIHTTTLTATSPITGNPIQITVVWADRHYSLCPGCRQHIGHEVPECPVILNPGAGGPGGQIEPVDQSCGHCGHWRAIQWQATEAGSDTGKIEQELAKVRGYLIEDQRSQIAKELAEAIQAARAALDEPLADDETIEDRVAEICTGSDSAPGVCWEDGRLSAWADGPVGDEPVIVYA